MPRQARLDAPGLLQHVMARGIERKKLVSKARAVISYLAVREAGYTQKEVADQLNISRIAVRRSLGRGEKVVDICQEIWETLV